MGQPGGVAPGQQGSSGGDSHSVSDWDSHGGSDFKGASGGGGGGGGGYANGQGGDKGVLGGGGGGGGSSYTEQLANFSHSLNMTDNASGWVKLGWVPHYAGTFALQKSDTAYSAQMMEDNSASSDAGHVIDTWWPDYDEQKALEPNYVWSYDYQIDKDAGLIRNRVSGLCLQVNGTDGKIDQWPCSSEAFNHLWTVVPTANEHVAIKIVLQTDVAQWRAGTYYLATTNDSALVVNGAQLTLNPNLNDNRVQWDWQPTS